MAGVGALVLPPTRRAVMLVKGSDGGSPRLSLAPWGGIGAPQDPAHHQAPTLVPAWASRSHPRSVVQPAPSPLGVQRAPRPSTGGWAPSHGPPQGPTRGMGYFWRGCTCQRCCWGWEGGKTETTRHGQELRAAPAMGLPWEGAAARPHLQCHGKWWPTHGVGPHAIHLFGSQELMGCRRAAAGGLDCSGAGDTAIGNTLSRQHRPALCGEPGSARAVPCLSQ